MKSRQEYSIGRRDGRHFTRRGLETYRRDLCQELRLTGKEGIATAYEEMSLVAFAAQGGYVIVAKSRARTAVPA